MLRLIVSVMAIFLCLVVQSSEAPASPNIFVETSIRDIENTSSRNLSIHRLADNPDIYVFDFPSLAQQGAMFNRLVALVERTEAPRDRPLTDDELADLIRSLGRQPTTFAFGNDFRTSELVKFFNLAEFRNVPLNEDEVLLRDFLVANELIKLRFGFYQLSLPDRVILSIPQEQAAGGPDSVPISHATRTTILHHEMSHAEYYTNEAYADYCVRFWAEEMSETERKAMRDYLSAKNYDPNNEELMINEMQAYLFHTLDSNAFNPRNVALPPGAIERLRQRFWGGKPPSRLFRNG